MAKGSKLLGVLRSKKSDAKSDQDEQRSVPTEYSQTDGPPKASKRPSALRRVFFNKKRLSKPGPLLSGLEASPGPSQSRAPVKFAIPEGYNSNVLSDSPSTNITSQQHSGIEETALSSSTVTSHPLARSPEHSYRSLSVDTLGFRYGALQQDSPVTSMAKPNVPTETVGSGPGDPSLDNGSRNSNIREPSTFYSVEGGKTRRNADNMKDKEWKRMENRARYRGAKFDTWRTSPDVLVKHMSAFAAEEDHDVIFWVLRQCRSVDKRSWQRALAAVVQECVENERCELLRKIETMDALQEHEHHESDVMEILGEICAGRAVTNWLERQVANGSSKSESLRWVLPHMERGDTAQWRRITNKLVLDFARQGRLTMLMAVVENGGDISPRNVNENGDTALHLAAGRGHAAVVRYLLAHGANGYVKNKRKWTPKHSAGENGHRECFFILHDALNPGMVPLIEGVNVGTSNPRDHHRRGDTGNGFSDRLGAYDRPLPGGGADPYPLRGSGVVVSMRARPFFELERRLNGG